MKYCKNDVKWGGGLVEHINSGTLPNDHLRNARDNLRKVCGTFDLVASKVNLASFSVLHSKCPVTLKQQDLEGYRLTLEIGGYL